MRISRYFKYFYLLGFISLYSCGDSNGGNGVQEETVPVDNGLLTYDQEVSSGKRLQFNQDIETQKSLQIDGSKIRRFNDIFGGPKSSDVISFMDTRINYVIDSETDINNRILVRELNAVQPETVATNIGMGLWQLSLALESQKIDFEINDSPVPINSGRTGIIQLGSIFDRLSTSERFGTLVHEARHSDCTGGMLQSDIERIRNNQQPLNYKCGHRHEICPGGHPYEGSFACDAHPWGAYVVQSIFAASIALTCANCSESQKTVAEAISIDSASRLLYDLNELLEGRLGPPDMSDSSRVE